MTRVLTLLIPLIFLSCGTDEAFDHEPTQQTPQISLDEIKSAYQSMNLLESTSTLLHQQINLGPAIAALPMNPNRPIIAVLDSGFDISDEAFRKRLWMLPRGVNSRCRDSRVGCNTSRYQLGDDQFGSGDITPDFTDEARCSIRNKNCFHGTTVASLALGFDPSRRIFGVCPVCQLLPIKVTNQRGMITDEAILGALAFISNLKAKGFPIVIINASFGKFSLSTEVSLAIKKLPHLENTIIVAAAGNENSSQRTYPASFNQAIAVASTEITDGTKGKYSNYGTWVDLSAPAGVRDRLNITTESLYLSGTSFAAPLVAGAAGLILATYPDLSPEQLKQRLRTGANAQQLYTANPSYIQDIGGSQLPLLGTGILDIANALDGASSTGLMPQERVLNQGCGAIGLGSTNGSLSLLVLILLPLLVRVRRL